MTVTVLATSDGYYADVTGAGYNDHGEIMLHKCDNPDAARMSLFSLLEVIIFQNNQNYTFLMNSTGISSNSE